MTSVPFDASAAPPETPRRPFFFISAGDPSGDAHAARLVEALERRFPNARFAGYAGPKTAATSCDVRVDLTQFAVMWIGRAVANLPNFLRILKNADKIFRDERPDAVILVDFPGFNWKIAKKAKAAGVPVVYFMPPQIWGWAQWRVKKMRRLTDFVLSCFAFEDAWFRENGVRSTLIGHPFFESTRNPQLDAAFLTDLGSAENGRSTAPPLADSTDKTDFNAANATAPTAVNVDAKTGDATVPNAETLAFVVELNSASKAELTNLPRVGEKLAERIVERREELGGFRSVDDLLGVKGIGEKTLDTMRPFCVVAPLDDAK